nr:MAG TPA: hypothetical protein [Caudoviricetes sp.]
MSVVPATDFSFIPTNDVTVKIWEFYNGLSNTNNFYA